jgi:predicted DNA-binding transcriptional regulator AlpA
MEVIMDIPNAEHVERRAAARQLRPNRKLQNRDLMARYGVADRTIDRWLADPHLGFPQPMVIKRRRYWDETEVDAFDAAQRARREAMLRDEAETTTIATP